MTAREHEQLAADLSAYLDGELEAGRSAEVEHWLAESEEARGLLAGLRAMRAAVHALPRHPAPADLSERIRAAAARRVLLPAAIPHRYRTLRIALQYSSAAAILIACVYVGYLALQPDPRSSALTGSVSPPGVTAHEPLSTDRIVTLGRASDGERYAPPESPVAATPTVRSGIHPELPPATLPPPAGRLPVRGDESYAREQVVADVLTESYGSHAGPVSGDATVESGSAGILAANETGRPVIHIVIQPETLAQYEATAALLAKWENVRMNQGVLRGFLDLDEGSGLTEANTLPPTPPGGAVTLTAQYGVASSDVAPRLTDLLAANSRERVRFETRLGAADADVMLQVAAAVNRAAATERLAQLDPDHLRSGLVRELDRLRARIRPQEVEDSTPKATEMTERPATTPPPTASRPHPPTGTSRDRAATGPAAGGGMRGNAAAAPAPRREQTEPREESVLPEARSVGRGRPDRRLRELFDEEAELERVLLDMLLRIAEQQARERAAGNTTTQPATDEVPSAAEPQPATIAERAPAPTATSADEVTADTRLLAELELRQRLLDLLFLTSASDTRAPGARSAEAPKDVPPGPVLFSVVVLPPTAELRPWEGLSPPLPPATPVTQPTTAPAAAPALAPAR